MCLVMQYNLMKRSVAGDDVKNISIIQFQTLGILRHARLGMKDQGQKHKPQGVGWSIRPVLVPQTFLAVQKSSLGNTFFIKCTLLQVPNKR